MTSHINSIPKYLLQSFLFFILAGQPIAILAAGCSAVDFGVARSFDATLSGPFPPAAYAAGDFNGDGKLDLVITDGSANGVTVMLNDGAGGFGPTKTYAAGAQPRAVAVSDLNGDGRLDLVVANIDSSNVSVLLGLGGGVFASPLHFAVVTSPIAIAIADLNGDGKKDLAVASGGSGQSVSVLLGNGDGTFSPAAGSPIGISGQASSVIAADFNSDSKLDLVVGSFSGVFLLTGDGIGHFTAPLNIFAGVGQSVASSDFNNDGKADLVIGANNGLVELFGNGNGTFLNPVTFEAESKSNIASVALADIDGDGKQDVVTTTDSTAGVSFFKGDGTGGFTPTKSYLPASEVSAVAVGDFDGDGDADLVAGRSLLVNIGAGVFEAARAVYSLTDIHGGFSATPTDLAFGDFNADGRPDMAVLHRALIGPDLSAARVAILLRDAAGNFNHASAITFPSGSILTSVVSGDFNQDGKADVAITASISSPFSHIVSISLSNGDGTFAPPGSINVFEQASDMIRGDFNNDGKPDLAVLTLHGSIWILIGDGAGGFSIGSAPNSGADFGHLAVADLNSDGKPDLIITDFFDSVLLTVSGDGTGSFFSLRSFPITGSPSSVAAGDFNSDGKNDVAVTSWNGGSGGLGLLSVLIGDGTGNLGGTSTYPMGERPQALIAADLDLDGSLDLAVADDFGPISVLSGTGTGLFQSPVNFTVWGRPQDLVVGDFNSDGRPDLAAALLGSRTVGLLFGKPSNSDPCMFADDVTTTEGDLTTTADVTIRLSAASGQLIKANYLLRRSTAIDGQDFISDSGTVVFQPGETVRTVPVSIIGDLLNEDAESLTLNLSSPQHARISDGEARINITDNDPVPTIAISDVSVTESDSTFNPVNASFAVTLSAPSGKPISVNFASASGSAVMGEDFDGIQGTLFFSTGETSKTITVATRGDLQHEPDETFFVNLSNASNATIADAQGQGTIINNDPIPAATVFDASAAEGNGVDTVVTITVRLANSSSLSSSIDFATADGTATAGSDYVATSGTLTFNPGETQKTFPVTIKDDPTDEVVETFVVNLSNPVNAVIADGQGSVSINDNDGPAVSINDVSIIEGSAGNASTAASFTLSLSAPSVQAITVRVATADGTATGNFDYQRVTTRIVSFPVGSSTATTNISVFADQAIEGNETFFVNLSSPQNCTIADSQGVGTIIDDDTTSAQLGTSSLTVNESEGRAAVTVLHAGDVSQPFTVRYQTSSGSASESSDFNAVSGSLEFAPGETSKTVTIFITDDALVESTETFFFSIFGANGGAVNSPSTATININSNDAPGAANPIDNSTFFVRQHYRDFLSRDPDADGLAFWVNQIESCGADIQCREIKRINVSAAFFLSIEFQETGYLVYLMHKSAYGNLPAAPVPVNLSDFLPDSQQISSGVVVGAPGWEQLLENNKQAFAADFVKRSRFVIAYPASLTPTEFVDALFSNTGITPSPGARADAINEFGLATSSADLAARGRALRRVAENSTFRQQQTNQAFVLMQYFGYLRRNPFDPPEATLDYSGYNFWLSKLNQFNGNFVNADMVKAFIVSGEYRARFGP
jgi:hypothetical protein